MKKRILTWITTMAVVFAMMIGGSTSVFAAGQEGYLD